MHEVAPQAYGAHGTADPAWQLPAPSQVAVSWLPAVHADAHTVAAGQSAHAPAWHVPLVPQLDAAVTTHRPRGSSTPFVAGAQVPFVPPLSAAEHAWQAVAHAVSQQKPSTQNPLWHWSAALHAELVGDVATQTVPRQKSPATQSPSLAQLVLHAIAPQAYGAQLVGSLHWPEAVQVSIAPEAHCVAPGVQTPPLELDEVLDELELLLEVDDELVVELDALELELVAPPVPEVLVELDALDDALWLELVAPSVPEVVEPPEPHPAARMAAIGAARGASFRRGRKR